MIDFEIIKTIAKRTHSQIFLIKYEGKRSAYKIISPSKQVTIEKLRTSYDRRMSLDNKDLVEVFKHWEADGKYHVIMEYLDGYQRVIDINLNIAEKIYSVLERIIASGIIDYDFDVANLMHKDGNLKLVDIDRLSTVDEILTDPHASKWFASRIIRTFQWITKKPLLQEVK
jgi:hypothetical protein